MKKLLVLLFVLAALPVMAQSKKAENNMPEQKDNRTWLSEQYKEQYPYPIAVGISGFGYVPFWGGLDAGGGFSVRGKFSIFKWLAVSLDAGYNHTSIKAATDNAYGTGVSSADIQFNAFELSSSLIFQRGIPRGQSGIEPWLGLGIGVNMTSVSYTGEESTSTGVQQSSGKLSVPGFAFLINAGINYNFSNNVYAGVRTDLNFTNALWLSGFKFGVEAGYRF